MNGDHLAEIFIAGIFIFIVLLWLLALLRVVLALFSIWTI